MVRHTHSCQLLLELVVELDYTFLQLMEQAGPCSQLVAEEQEQEESHKRSAVAEALEQEEFHTHPIAAAAACAVLHTHPSAVAAAAVVPSAVHTHPGPLADHTLPSVAAAGAAESQTDHTHPYSLVSADPEFPAYPPSEHDEAPPLALQPLGVLQRTLLSRLEWKESLSRWRFPDETLGVQMVGRKG